MSTATKKQTAKSNPQAGGVQLYTTLVATRTIHEAHNGEVILPGTVMLVVNSNGGFSPHVLFPAGESQACYGRLSSTDLKGATRVARFRDHLPLTAQLFHAHTASQGEIQIARYFEPGEYVKLVTPIIDARGGVIPRGTYMQCLEGGERPRFRYMHHLSYELLEHADLHEQINRRVRPAAPEEIRDVDQFVKLDVTHQVDPDDLEEGYCLALMPAGGDVTKVIKRAGMPEAIEAPHDPDILGYDAIRSPVRPALVHEILREFRNNGYRAENSSIVGMSHGELIAAYVAYRLSWLAPVMSFHEFQNAQRRRAEVRSGVRGKRQNLEDLLQAC